MEDLPLFLYTDRPHKSLDVKELLQYLKGLGFATELRGDLFEALEIPLDEAATGLARCRILDLLKEGSLNLRPEKNDITHEAMILNSAAPVELKNDMSNVYDALAFARFLRSFVKRGLHIVFTSRMSATFEGTRYHGRAISMDFPLALISTTGIVEAPAKPQEFYIKHAAYHRAEQAGLTVPEKDDFMRELKEEFKGRFIDYDDPRMTEAAEGYTLQAIFYLLWGETFCDDPECRLYNAHTQEEMIHAQIVGGRLCERHQALLDKLQISK